MQLKDLWQKFNKKKKKNIEPKPENKTLDKFVL
jgi:hypothetical protein